MQEPGFDFANVSIDVISQYKLFIILQMNLAIDNIINVDTTRTYNNTVQPLLNVNYLVESRKSIFDYVTNFYPNKELRDFTTDVEQEIKKYLIDAFMRKDLYNAFVDYQNTTYLTEKDSLTHEENRYFEHEMRDFKRSGLHLDDENYDKVKSMLKELSELSTNYQKNLNEVTTSFGFTKEELDGMPDHWFNDDKLIKDEHGNNTNQYKVTLKYPDYMPAIDYIKSDSVRKQLWTAYNSRCAKENTEILTRVIHLRYLVAQLLGYKNYADYEVETKVMKTGDNAINFEMSMNEKFEELYQTDMSAMLNFAKTQSKNPLDKDNFDPWDFRYYNREFTESECEINMEEVRKYFPLDVVKKGLLDIYQLLLGLTFTEIPTTNKWHEDVNLYKVNDKATDDLLGYFYLDLHPRDGKYGHAAAFDFVTGCDLSNITGKNERQHHIMAVACNFPKDGNVDFDDVVTFFHEFGHVMHQICSKPQLQSFAGFGIERDFVEAPSQMLENWVYTKEALNLLSKHSETNESIPQEIIDKLRKKKNFLGGIHYKRQLFYGIVDLRLHLLTDFENGLDLQKLWYEIEKNIMGFETSEKVFQFANFGHIVGGYAAGYYGYLRADTYAANMFHKMFKNGHVLDHEMGMRYRTKLLEPGSSKDALELLEDFLGENTNDDYFLEEVGLKKN